MQQRLQTAAGASWSWGANCAAVQGWPMYAQLLIDLFKYLAPFLRNVELNKPMQILYKVSSPPLAAACWAGGRDLLSLWAVSGHAAGAAGPAARLPRVPV